MRSITINEVERKEVLINTSLRVAADPDFASLSKSEWLLRKAAVRGKKPKGEMIGYRYC